MVKAFKLESSIDDVRVKVEKKRDKGGGFVKKRPEEKLAYLRLLALPCVYFEYQYLKKKGLFGSKVPHRSSTVYSPYNPPPIWSPKLIREVVENKLFELEEGYYVPMDQESAEEAVASFFASFKNERVNPEAEKKYKEFLNLDSDTEDLQTILEVSVIYLPYWVARLEIPERTRYLVYDRLGKEDKAMSSKFNTEYDFVTDLEDSVEEI